MHRYWNLILGRNEDGTIRSLSPNVEQTWVGVVDNEIRPDLNDDSTVATSDTCWAQLNEIVDGGVPECGLIVHTDVVFGTHLSLELATEDEWKRMLRDVGGVSSADHPMWPRFMAAAEQTILVTV